MSESEQTTAPAEDRKPKRRRRKLRRRQSGWDLRQFQVPAVAGKWRFHDFDLPLPLMRAIHALGFEYCTPIQAEALTRLWDFLWALLETHWHKSPSLNRHHHA